MKKELFETGKSVDTAIDSACEKLGCSREDCEWEIIDLPKKGGFLGLKNIPAKVRVSIEIPDEKPPKAQRPPQPEIRKQQQAAKPQPQKQAKTQQPDAGKKPLPTRPPVPKKPESLQPPELSEKEASARDYLAEVLGVAGLKADFLVTRDHNGSCINIVGEGLGMIIGRRGETLDAIQYLAGLVANRGDGDYLRLTVDCGDYRVKRKGTLEALARKLANQVIKTNTSKTLEPMNPFERRIIHATVSEIEGVSSSSVGEEPNRRVVITSPSAKPAPKAAYRGDREAPRDSYSGNRSPRRESRPQTERSETNEKTERGGYNRDNRDSRDNRDNRRGGGRPPRQQAQPAPQGPPKQTLESEVTAGISIGKIDL